VITSCNADVVGHDWRLYSGLKLKHEFARCYFNFISFIIVGLLFYVTVMYSMLSFMTN
jgi:hypothetical protein